MFDIHPNWRDPYYDVPACKECGTDLKDNEEYYCEECENEE